MHKATSSGHSSEKNCSSTINIEKVMAVLMSENAKRRLILGLATMLVNKTLYIPLMDCCIFEKLRRPLTDVIFFKYGPKECTYADGLSLLAA